jgi:uncharacterized membrane protein
LALAWATILHAQPEHIQRTTQLQDFGRSIIFVLVVTAATISLLSVGLLLGPAEITESYSVLHLLQSVIAVISSWCLTHTVYTLHYAHLFYLPSPHGLSERKARGLEFPGGTDPDYVDFAYFAFVIGMTCQVSDVQITSRRMRKLVLIHSVLSFGFNTLILALSVNVIAQILDRSV